MKMVPIDKWTHVLSYEITVKVSFHYYFRLLFIHAWDLMNLKIPNAQKSHSGHFFLEFGTLQIPWLFSSDQPFTRPSSALASLSISDNQCPIPQLATVFAQFWRLAHSHIIPLWYYKLPRSTTLLLSRISPIQNPVAKPFFSKAL